MRKTLLVPILAAIALGGCSWGITLTEPGRLVRTDWSGNMDSCQRLGKVTVSVADHLGPIDRNQIKVRDELEVLARNQAANMSGADTVHPLAEPSDGSQAWGVYRCGMASTSTAAPAASNASSSGAQTFPIGSHTH